MARAFGNHELKMQQDENGKVHMHDYLSIEPEIRQFEINPFTDDFILMGSDGLFDKLSSQECCTFIRSEMSSMKYGENNLKSIAQ